MEIQHDEIILPNRISIAPDKNLPGNIYKTPNYLVENGRTTLVQKGTNST